MLAHSVLVAALRWNPTVRGVLFPLIMIVILCGSSYMLLSTNVGNRLGFLIAAACLFGWLTLLAGAWTIYGIGLKGRQPAWKVQEVLQGDSLKDAQQAKVRLLAKGTPKIPKNPGKGKLKIVPEGTPVRGDAQAVADAYLKENKFFDNATLYTPMPLAYEFGGDNQLFTLNRHKFYLRSSPHYFVSQVQAVVFKKVPNPLVLPADCPPGTEKTKDDVPCQIDEAVKNADGSPKLDTAKPLTTIVSLRDRGSIRQPSFMIFLFSAILTGIICSVLHRRDKQVMAARASLAKA